MIMIIQIRGIESKFMVVWQNPPVGASKRSELFAATLSRSPKQGCVPC